MKVLLLNEMKKIVLTRFTDEDAAITIIIKQVKRVRLSFCSTIALDILCNVFGRPVNSSAIVIKKEITRIKFPNIKTKTKLTVL